jgi:hypothetical protein
MKNPDFSDGMGNEFHGEKDITIRIENQEVRWGSFGAGYGLTEAHFPHC